MAHEEEAHHPREEPVPDFEQALSNLSNPELLSALDLALLELEKRLFRYAKVGPELLEIADEGLVLAARAKARLGQSLFCSPAHRGPPAGGGCGRVAAHEHPPCVECRAAPPARGARGGLLATALSSSEVSHHPSLMLHIPAPIRAEVSLFLRPSTVFNSC
jgi:hypothetical protein